MPQTGIHAFCLFSRLEHGAAAPLYQHANRWRARCPWPHSVTLRSRPGDGAIVAAMAGVQGPQRVAVGRDGGHRRERRAGCEGLVECRRRLGAGADPQTVAAGLAVDAGPEVVLVIAALAVAR